MSAARRAAVLGHPIGHSLSPVLHRAAYLDLGLSGWTYDAIDVPDARALAELLGRCGPQWAGLSLTMPLKRLVQPLLDEVSGVARAVGAVNTVVLAEDGRRCGHNTDVAGIAAALAEAGVQRVEPGDGLILGGGATAASAVAALAELGESAPRVAVRSPERAREVLAAAERLGVHPELVGFDEAVPWLATARAVVSTVPAGGSAAVAEAVRRADAVSGVLLDVVYEPWPTPGARAWAAAGGRTVSGLSMLLHQAVDQVRLMTGRTPSVPVLRAALERELDARTPASPGWLKASDPAADIPS